MKASNLEVWVNDKGPFLGSLQIDTEVIDVTSSRDSYKPDPKWEYVDKAGHWHAFTSDGKHPTMERYEKPVPCDGSCGGVCGGEGYSETRYRCRACGKRVKPNFVVDKPAFTPQRIPGRSDWRVNVAGRFEAMPAVRHPDQVTVRVTQDGRTFFGLAALGDFSYCSDGTSEIAFVGTTELGQRS